MDAYGVCILVYGTDTSSDLQEAGLPLSTLKGEVAPDFSELGLSSVESQFFVDKLCWLALESTQSSLHF